MSETRERWQAYDTTPGGGTAGWAFIRQLEGAFDFHGYVFGIANREDARKLKAHLNALERERDELREIASDLLDDIGMCNLTDGVKPFCLAHHQRHPCSVQETRSRYDSLIQEGK